MICLICNKEILKEDLRFFFGNDKPYFNLWLHRQCYISTDMENFIKENVTSILSGYKNNTKK
jgi:hypothetical protein